MSGLSWLQRRQALLAWVVMGLIVAAGFAALQAGDRIDDQQRDAIAADQRRLDEAVIELKRLSDAVAAESEQRGVAGCRAIVTIRNALVGATQRSDTEPLDAAEQRRRAEGLAAFDALLQPALDDLCPNSGITLGGQ